MNLRWHARRHRMALEGMRDLTLEERGAYNTCLDLIYEREGPIPDDARWIAGWLGVGPRMWLRIRAALIAKGKLHEVEVDREPRLMNRRAAIELAAQAKLIEQRREMGAKRGQKAAVTDSESKGIKASTEAEVQPETGTVTGKDSGDADAPLSPARGDDGSGKGGFEACWTAYPHVRGRSSRKLAERAWSRLTAAARAGLPAAIARYAAEGREPKAACGAPAMDRWLREARYADWLEAAEAATGPPAVFAGPAEVRAAVARARGESFARSWLDRCAWDEARRAVVSGNGFVAERLAREVGPVLSKLDVRIERRG